MKKLESLCDHVRKFWESFKVQPTYPWSGIACPNCGEERTIDTSLILNSNPPRYRVYCKKCGFDGSVC